MFFRCENQVHRREGGGTLKDDEAGRVMNQASVRVAADNIADKTFLFHELIVLRTGGEVKRSIPDW